MQDLISRQAAIAEFNCCELTPDGGIDANDAIDILERLPSAYQEPQWIPCSERLPEERGFYLTTTKDKAVYCDYWNEDNFDRTEMVISWMPLPEPYKGGKPMSDLIGRQAAIDAVKKH